MNNWNNQQNAEPEPDSSDDWCQIEQDPWDDDYYEEPYYDDFEPEEEEEERKHSRPPLGVLSRGPVWSACPEIVYADHHDYLHHILACLSLPECVELVEFLCGLDQVCRVADCEFLSRDQFRDDMSIAAARKGDQAMSRRYRALVKCPMLTDQEFEDLLVRSKRELAKTQRKARRLSR